MTQPILEVGVTGRGTLPTAFVPGDPITLSLRMVNAADRARRLKLHFEPGDFSVTVAKVGGKGTAWTYDPVSYHLSEFRKNCPDMVVMPPGGSGNSWTNVAPGGRVDRWAMRVIYVERDGGKGSSSRTCGGLPMERLAEPGLYTIAVTYRNRDSRGWIGEIGPGACGVEILSAERRVELEKRVKVPRTEAEPKALSAARAALGSGVMVTQPLRLIMRGTDRHWHAVYGVDNGLTARWIDVQVDATTGEVKTKPVRGGA